MTRPFWIPKNPTTYQAALLVATNEGQNREPRQRLSSLCSYKTEDRKLLGLLQAVADPFRPWEIRMDFIVDLPESNGHTVIWTVIDLFSKKVHFVPCSGLLSARKLEKLFIGHVYRLHRVPLHIISDRGVQFGSGKT